MRGCPGGTARAGNQACTPGMRERKQHVTHLLKNLQRGAARLRPGRTLALALAVLPLVCLAPACARPQAAASDDTPPAAAPGAPALAVPGAPAPAAPGAPVPDNAALPAQPCPAFMGSSAGRTALPPVAPPTLARIRERLAARVGTVSSVCRTPFGLLEVIVDGEIFYVDERANYLINGNAFDLRSSENLTAQRKEDAFRIDFSTLPLDLAVKTVRGDGSRTLAIFEDPNCPYCKRFEKDIATLGNATIYTFLYPILSRDAKAPDDSYPKSKSIWCAPDRPAAWAQVMLEGRHLDFAPDSCKDPLAEILALGQKLHVVGTPTIIFTDGRRAPGMIPIDRVEHMIAEAAHPAPKAQ
jgi:thiol:disulfide interchange protein DsbC